MHRYAALGSLIQRSQGIAVASMLNRGNVFVSPYNCPFPFHQDEMPPSISSPAWSTLDLNATGVDDLYPEGLHPEQIQSGCLQAWHSSHLAGLAMHACRASHPLLKAFLQALGAYRGDVHYLITLMRRIEAFC